MKVLIKYSLTIILSIGLLASCSETRKKATERLDELSNQAEELNNLVDDKLKQFNNLDSVIDAGGERIKKIDSLVQNASSKIDSAAKEEVDAWKNITN